MKRRDSALRDAFVGVLMTVGPFFGVRYQRPHVEVATVSTPGSDEDSTPELTSARPLERHQVDDDGISL